MGKKLTAKTSIPGVYRRRNGSLIIDKLYQGKRIYENLGCTTVELAGAVLAKRIASVTEEQYFPDKPDRSLKVENVLSFYWEQKLKYVPSQNTRKFHLSKLADRLGSMICSELTVAHIDKYKRDRLASTTWYGKPVSPRTVNAELNELNSALRHALVCRMIPFNPIVGYKPVPQPKPKKVMLDKGMPDGPEWLRLYNAACDELKPVLVVLYETGMRPSEVFNMQWCWIDEINKLITIPALHEKTGDGRMIPMSSRLIAELRGLKKTSDYVFLSKRTGKPITTIKRAFHGAVVRAGLQNRGITPYALRRTRLTIWDGMDHIAAMSAGDHTQVRTHVDHYVSVNEERLMRLVV